MSKIQKALNKAREENVRAERSKIRPLVHEEVEEPVAKEPQKGAPRTRIQKPRPRVLERNRILTSIADQSVLDAYHLLRTKILQYMCEYRWNTILVTSPNPGEGKTTTAINLGLSLARDPQSTALVVDVNLRSPKVHAYLDLDCPQGLTDYLTDGAQLPDLLVCPDEKDFVVLPAGRALQDPTDTLGSERMKSLMREMKPRYPDRYIIFDCPHLVGMPESLMLTSQVDAVLLVVEASRTSRDDVQNAFSVLEGCNVLGLVMNKLYE